jgi:hypothetical protein
MTYAKGLPVAFALTGAKADERQTLLAILAADPALAAHRPGQILIADRHCYGTGFEATLAAQRLRLLHPACKGEHDRPAHTCSSPCARSSNRSTRPSKPSSAWNATAGTPRPELQRQFADARQSALCLLCKRALPSPGGVVTPRPGGELQLGRA